MRREFVVNDGGKNTSMPVLPCGLSTITGPGEWRVGPSWNNCLKRP